MSELEEVENELLRHPDPVVKVPELVDRLGRSDTHIRDKLEQLEYLDRVASKDVGARATAWWHVERVTPARALGDDEPQGQSALAREAAEEPHSAESDDASEGLDVDSPTERYAEAKNEAVSRALPLEDVDFPDSRQPAECYGAVLAAADYIEEHGGATMREIVTNVGPTIPIGYDVPEQLEQGERYRGAWWRHVVKPGLEALEAVEKPPQGGSEWRWSE